MALKLEVKWIAEGSVFVLIVPLWNWNERNAFDLSHNDGSNCTFMELKYGLEGSLMKKD